MSFISLGEFLAFVSWNISSVSFLSFLLSGTHIACTLDHLTHILYTSYPLLYVFYPLASLCFILDTSFWPIFHFMNFLFSWILSVLKSFYWDLCFKYCFLSSKTSVLFSFSAPPSCPALLFSSLWHIYTQLRSERHKLISLKLLTKLRCVTTLRPNYNSIFSFSIHSCIPCCSQFTLCQQYS